MKTKKVYVKRGFLYAEAATAAEAKMALNAQIDWACYNVASQIENRYGLLIFLHASAAGFSYSIVDPAKTAHGQEHYSSCCLGQISYSDALNFARSHACQYAWHRGLIDADHISAAQVLPASAKELQSLFSGYRAQPIAA